MSAWAKFPTEWIIQKKLISFSWQKDKSDAIAALLVLIALSIKFNTSKIGLTPEQRSLLSESEMVKATYDEILDMVDISRIKVANGLAILMQQNLIQRSPDNPSVYKIPGINEAGKWGKLPQSLLLRDDRLVGFYTLTLRNKHELNALKLYLVMLAFRSSATSYASLGYPTLTEYTGVAGNDIKKAKSHLINMGLISVDTNIEFVKDNTKPSLRYKLIGL